MVLFSCAVCLDEWSDPETLRSLACGHIFCGACIRELLMQPRPQCPTCRAGPIRPSHLRPVYITVETRAGSESMTSNDASSRRIEALERSIRDLRVDGRALSYLAEQLTDARDELAELREEARRVRNEHRHSTELAYSRLDELEDAQSELDRLRTELQRARETARVNEMKYKNLNVNVQGAVKTLSRFSEPLDNSLPRSRPNCNSIRTSYDSRVGKGGGFW
ncbi:unnamed protein product [Peniophora sp. CBMAI 1063]|nr:unnamed protein product [Peniophora sp. CBMAI 1063]